jgi:hypothetical protein
MRHDWNPKPLLAGHSRLESKRRFRCGCVVG